MKIKLYNKIDQIGLKQFDEKYTVGEDVTDEDGILVRSANLLETEFPANLKAIARAGAGVNNIPVDECAKKGIVVFNTPGANANAVKELTICGLLLTSRKIIQGYEWARTVEENFSKTVEKGKSAFAGHELYRKKLGVIGLGAIGANVANAALDLGMDVYGYDPYISIQAAWNLNHQVKHVDKLDELLKEVDYLTIHIPSLETTKGFINKETIDKMKDGVKILNFARGDLVKEEDLIEALSNGKVENYITDFGSQALCKLDNVICLPHLGASTAESEENCAVMAVHEIMDYLENGNIVNSVNMPDISEAWNTKIRVCIIHMNVPNMLAQFATLIANNHINIENMSNKARKDYAYTIIDTNDPIDPELFEKIENVIKVRILQK
ncbi:MAG: phosphoglycerate dehydrogenase [Erysipelotrichaceae bacterium]|nr:phosphoglycerate dehydrogenase [Erysipelotrichaceae bacterium]